MNGSRAVRSSRDGLTAGEEVVTDGQLRLTPGARIAERSDGGSRRGGQ